jgi:hypothetical protein
LNLIQTCTLPACLPKRNPSPAKRARSRWRRGAEGRSTLTAGASHTIAGARHAAVQQMRLDMVSDKSRSRSVQGLNADRSQPWIVRGHGKTAVVVAEWTRLRPVGRTLRKVFQPLHEYCVGDCADDSPDAAWSAARPVNWTPTRMLRVRQANCHADFSDNCPDAS